MAPMSPRAPNCAPGSGIVRVFDEFAARVELETSGAAAKPAKWILRQTHGDAADRYERPVNNHGLCSDMLKHL